MRNFISTASLQLLLITKILEENPSAVVIALVIAIHLSINQSINQSINLLEYGSSKAGLQSHTKITSFIL